MNCQVARQLFSTHLDGELSPAEVKALDAHLAGCTACVTELELAQELCAALREGVMPVAAPPGFARSVTAAIEKRRDRGWLAGPGRAVAGWRHGLWLAVGRVTTSSASGSSGLVAGWRHGLAAAAACLLIAAVALGYGAQQWLGQTPLVAQDDPPSASGLDVVAPPGTEPVEPVGPGVNETSDGKPSPGGVSGDSSQAPDSGADTGADTGSGAGTDTGTATGPGKTRPDREPGSTQVAGVPDVEQKVFLNKQRSIGNTLLEVDVDDLVRAQNEVFLLAGEIGATVVSAQRVLDGDAPAEALRFQVDSAQVEAFTERLGGLGRVVHREDNSRDITERFATTLENYRTLVAERERATDPDERTALDKKIAPLEQDLAEWDQEAGQYPVTLILR
jgi:anti-sigma factor RsiW